jgi:hypothetical protein
MMTAARERLKLALRAQAQSDAAARAAPAR